MIERTLRLKLGNVTLDRYPAEIIKIPPDDSENRENCVIARQVLTVFFDKGSRAPRISKALRGIYRFGMEAGVSEEEWVDAELFALEALDQQCIKHGLDNGWRTET